MTFFWLSLTAVLFLIAFGFWAWRALRPVSSIASKEEGSALQIPLPESRYIEIDGVNVHFTQGGAGADVVLLHGIGASVYVWRFLFPLLQSKVRVTAIDLPGFGKSTKDAGRDYGLDSQSEIIAKALEVIGITNATLIGSSMGGAIALWLGKKYPERFAKVVAIGPATDNRLVPALADLFGPMAPFFRHALNRHSMRLILTRVLRRNELITKESVEAYLEPFRGNTDAIKAFWASLTLLSDKRLPDELVDIKIKVLVLYGERDFMVPRSSIDKLLQHLPQATFLSHPHGGHHVMEDEPLWSAERILAFIEDPDKDGN